MAKIKTYSLVNNYFQVHFIKGEWETAEIGGSLNEIERSLSRLGDALVIGFDKKLLTNKEEE